jgi:3-oxoacyl-[acyl-carrier-protein] synthase-3
MRVDPRKNRDSRKKTHIRGEDTTTMGVKAAEVAIARSGLAKKILILSFCNLSPDYYFPGPGVLVQRDLGLRTVGALDVESMFRIYLCLVCC